MDRPIAGLLQDLKSRGLLKDTIVLWGGEFGRTPTAQGSDGRDHNPEAFTMWLAGGGVKAILHLLGLDHTKLTYRYAGRDLRLTDVHGSVVHDIIT